MRFECSPVSQHFTRFFEKQSFGSKKITWCFISLLFSNGRENMSKYKKYGGLLFCFNYVVQLQMSFLWASRLRPDCHILLPFKTDNSIIFKSDHPVASRFCSHATFCSSVPCILVIWWLQLLLDCMIISQMLYIPSYFPVSLLCVYPGTALRYISATSVLLNSSPSSAHILLPCNIGGIAVNL